jgi:hypothetical protein
MAKHMQWTPARGCLAKTRAQRMNTLYAMTARALIEQARAQACLCHDTEQVSVALGELPGTTRELSLALMLRNVR